MGRRGRAEPQRLKPHLPAAANGTTEVVPFPTTAALLAHQLSPQFGMC